MDLTNHIPQGGYCFWWRKRIVAVFIPYFVIQCILYWPFHKFNIIDFVLDVTLISPRYHNGWYLNYLLVCYMVFYLVMRIPFLRKHKITVFTVFSVASFFLLREIKAEQGISFLTGIVLSEYKESEFIQKHSNWKTGIFLLAIGIVALAIKQIDIIRNSPQIIYNFIQLLIKLPCGLGLCFVLLSIGKKLNLKIFVVIGAISYELYLVHGYILQWVNVSLTGEIIFIVGSVVGAMVLYYTMRFIRQSVKFVKR